MTTIYLKLGGSLITDKRQAETPRREVIERLAGEIAWAQRARPDLRLVVGHGSGSFGHVVGQRYGTRHGVDTPEGWYGFAATGDAAARLNRIVTGALLAAGIPAWSIQPGAALLCEGGRIVEGPAATVRRALDAGLTPVVFGDVALDRARGGVIASTEEIFDYLGEQIPPARIVLAGEVDGVYSADPLLAPDAQHIEEITPATAPAILGGLGGSHGVDVTGGMAAKVGHVLDLLAAHPGLEVIICSGLQPGAVARALTEAECAVGTRFWNPA